MPFKKKRVSKKRYRRRRSRYNSNSSWGGWFRKNTAKGLAASAMIGVEYLKGLVNSEMHKCEVGFNGTTIPITGSVTHLSPVAVGDTYADRTGNSIYARALNIRYTASWNQTTAGLQQIRLMVVQDTQQVGDTTPSISDILDSSAVNYTLAHMAPNSVGRFKVLKSIRFDLTSVYQSQTSEINIPMRHHIRYNGTAATDIQKGGLYLVVASNVVSSNFPFLYAQSRLSFHDN